MKISAELKQKIKEEIEDKALSAFLGKHNREIGKPIEGEVNSYINSKEFKKWIRNSIVSYFESSFDEDGLEAFISRKKIEALHRTAAESVFLK